MKNINNLKYLIVLITAIIISMPVCSNADESLALYGLKGYAYTFSPLPSKGLYVQTGAMYSVFNDGLENGDGHTFALPLSVTYGNGQWWEAAGAVHYESWENSDLDISEKGMGDLFLGGKIRLLKDLPDISLMPYILIPTGSRDKGIGDMYYLNPSPDDDPSYGLNLLIGGQVNRFYLSANIGVNYADTDREWLDSASMFFGLAAEYQISETWMTYAEFVNTGNKNNIDCDTCIDTGADEDLREIGAGLVWLKDKWGFKFHAGAGLTDTSPDFRVIGLINLGF
ncbi:Uncharacterized protein dnl_19770 [Desulfonema limicola]|uniref:Uncharacterized protein n=1 Tax=Desulfonema limicola TaxID=45656 RepID=A0A975B6K2_9BACT|nr:transporter [Desulfonema limicola]QTA79701.1 Uncharacterized protein dnl_19770 [Desulfonema limicola]